MTIRAKIWGDWVTYEVTEYGITTWIVLLHADSFFSLEDIMEFHERSRDMVTSDAKVSQN